MDTCVERRAPLLPMGSFTTWISSDWPSFRIFSIGRCSPVPLRAAPDVGHVQEGRARQPDLDERRLHARQHAAHAPEVDVAHQAAARVALDVQLLHRALLGDRHPRLLRGDVNEDLLVHLVVERDHR